MAVLGALNPTLADWLQKIDVDGNVAAIVELLSEMNEILEDMVWVQGNLPTGHQTTVRTGLPSIAWRMLNYGVPQSKSRSVKVTDTCGMMEGYQEIDKALADLNGNTAEFRLDEDRSFLEQFNQTLATALFYGNTDTDPEQILGLAPRYPDLSTSETSANVINADYSSAAAGATQSSIWLVVWSPMTCFGVFPKGSQMGFQHKDLGEVTLEDDAGGKFQGYRTHYKWDCGLCVRDWRYVIRIANVDVDLLDVSSTPDPDLIRLMVDATEQIEGLSIGRPVFYCNRKIKRYLRHHQRLGQNVNLSLQEAGGKKFLAFDNIPVRTCDALTETEALLT